MSEGVFDACRYLASNTSGRPNMAVYGLDAGPAAFEKLQEKGAGFLASVQQLEKRGLFRTFLYQFSVQSGSGVIPGLSVQEGNAVFEKLTLYREGKPDARLEGCRGTAGPAAGGPDGSAGTYAGAALGELPGALAQTAL